MPLKRLSFDYLPLSFLDHQGKVSTFYRPMIPVRIAVKGRTSVFTWALVDSGADRNLFPAVFGLQVGLDLRRGERSEVVGIGGHRLSIYTCRVKLLVVASVPAIFDTEVDFSYEHEYPILGRNGFFNLFRKIEFRERKRVVELTF